MAKEYEYEINLLREKIDQARDIRIRAETRLEQLNRQKDELSNELEKIGVSPEELDREIIRLKDEIEDLIKKANHLIPREIFKGDYKL